MNLEINGTVLTNQPTRGRDLPVEGTFQQGINGAFTHTAPEYGRRIRFVWGVDAVRAAVVTELRTVRGGEKLHTIKFTDPAGVTHELNVLWPHDPAYEIQLFDTFRPVVVDFFETDAEPEGS